jgi:mRNA-degrading endonuclease RelE of RelBE toxin-antitoxin system
MAYRLVYSPEGEDHLRALVARDRMIVLDAVDEQLTHQPTTETRNRKPLRPNPLAPWELRIGDLRVYYDVEDDPEPVVRVRAVGIKDHNELRIGGEIVKL